MFIQTMGHGVFLRLFQTGGLCLAPPLRYGLSKIGEEHGDQQDDGDDQL